MLLNSNAVARPRAAAKLQQTQDRVHPHSNKLIQSVNIERILEMIGGDVA